MNHLLDKYEKECELFYLIANKDVHGYYPKFGFVPASRWGINAPFEVPSGAFMGIELEDNGLQGVSGTVRYPPAFEMV